MVELTKSSENTVKNLDKLDNLFEKVNLEFNNLESFLE